MTESGERFESFTIDAFLEKLSKFVGDGYGRQFRSSFRDSRGSSELAMLVSPTKEEFEELKRAVAIMTPGEKENAANLTDQQVMKIASDAGVDQAKLAIFMNGYALECKRAGKS